MGRAGFAPGGLALLIALSGCGAQNQNNDGEDEQTSASSGSGSGGSGSDASQSSTNGSTSGGAEPGDPEVVTRVARLTHEQYNATVQDLFGISDSPADAFAPDALNGFDFETSVDFEVDARLGPQYRTAAETLAARVVGDPEVLARIVPCSEADAGCADEFIDGFGERAFRRPLGEEEHARFALLFEQGSTLVASGDAFRDGVELVVEAMLQSPQFLYRTELGTDEGDDGLIALDDYEIASRLSYFVLNSMPPDDLFERASRGELETSEQIEGAALDLLQLERAPAQLVSFHAQAWDFSRYSKITPDAETYPAAPEGIVDSARLASERFVESVIEAGGGLSELLTAPYAFADAGLAPLYGADVESTMTRIELDADERKGYLMQVGFLASHAYAIDTDPIHRGLFVVRKLLCMDIPEPPPGASMTPLPETDEPIETTREEVELLTGQDGCTTCHQFINPPGFAFEGFDAVGQVRRTENDVTVDTSGSVNLDGAEVVFSGPLELVDALAQSSDARACYAQKWLEFAYGRALGDADRAVATTLSTDAMSVHQIVAAVSTTNAFTHRKPNQVAP